jgi:hypothetical protein
MLYQNIIKRQTEEQIDRQCEVPGFHGDEDDDDDDDDLHFGAV